MKEEYSYSPTETRLGPLPVFIADWNLLSAISEQQMAVGIDEGQIQLILPDQISYAFGANPCVAGVSFHQNKLRLFHSSDLVSPYGIFTNTHGIIGGNPKLMSEYQQSLHDNNYQIIEPKNPSQDFNIAVVRKKINDPEINLQLSPGIYFAYLDEDDNLEDTISI